MQFFIFVLAICFFIFLFVLYSLSKDDFLIIRKDVSLESLFNTAFSVAFVSLFFARFFYVIFNPTPILKTFLGFMVFPYFPGLSLAGGLIGGLSYLLIHVNYRKMPVGRIFDIFILSLSTVLPISILGTILLTGFKNTLSFGILFLIYLIISIISFKIVWPYSQKNNLREGSLGIIFLTILSLINYLFNIIVSWGRVELFNKDNLLWIIILIISIAAIVKQEIAVKSSIKK